MDKFKSGFAAIIGRPNVGKSTLMNHLIGQKIAITSARPQTTRNRIETVYTDAERGQIIFLDTPGYIRKTKNRLGEYMTDTSIAALADADVILWLVEPSEFIGDADKALMEHLSKVSTPVILVVSKIDTVAKEALAHILEIWKKAFPFRDVIAVSGLRGLNLDTLTEAVFEALPEGPMLYDPETLTDQPMRQIASEVVREKALRMLSAEIPHGIAVVIDRYHQREDGLTEIEASVICEKESHKRIVIGKGGEMLKRIGTAARRDLEQLTGERVFLKLFVKIRKDWRDNETLLRNYGYERTKRS
jgi:GTP-binding protein Era